FDDRDAPPEMATMDLALGWIREKLLQRVLTCAVEESISNVARRPGRHDKRLGGQLGERIDHLRGSELTVAGDSDGGLSREHAFEHAEPRQHDAFRRR